MKEITVTVRRRLGLHARPASELILLVQRFHSEIRFRKGSLLVDGKSILGILMLGAALNTQLDVLVTGEDEDVAAREVETFFSVDDATGTDMRNG